MISKIATRDGYGKRLAELDNDKIVVLTADLGRSSGTGAFSEKHPDRFIQVGISEQDMFGIANGLGLNGKIPFTNTFASFCLRGYEQIRLIAINNSNVKVVGHYAGINLGKDGVSQMCEMDISAFRTLPNFTVVVPCDALEAQKAVDAIVARDGPCYLRLSREPSPIITNEYSSFKIGRAGILREGSDVLIVACGMMVALALEAANTLEELGIHTTVMNMHTIKPLDAKALEIYAQKCGAVVTIEEHSIYGGLGSAVAESLSQSKIPIRIIGINDTFGESGTCDELFKKFGLTSEHIVQEVQVINQIKTKANTPTNQSSYDSTMKPVEELIKPVVNTQPIPEQPKKMEYDPRGRITKLTDAQKQQFNDVLNKMFGGKRQ